MYPRFCIDNGVHPLRECSVFSFPSEECTSKLLNRGARTTFFALERKVSVLCAVDQVIHILETEKVQTIVKIDRPEVSELIRAFKNSGSLEERVRL